MIDDATEKALANLSGSARRLLDYLAVIDGPGRYAVLRHLVRVPEPDMVADLQETVAAGLVAAAAGDPNAYDFTDPAIRTHVLAEIGEARLPKLRTRAQVALDSISGNPRGNP